MKARGKLTTNFMVFHTTVALYMAVITFGKNFQILKKICQKMLTFYYSEVMNIDSGKWYDCNDSWVKQISGPD